MFRSGLQIVQKQASAARPAGARRTAFRALAVGASGLGTLGLLLPLLPTTPFLLLALWAAARSDPALHRRLRAHPRFGPTLTAWEIHGTIPSAARWTALAMLTTSWLVLWIGGAANGLLIGLAILFGALLAFLFSRPLPPEPGRSPQHE